MFKVSGVTVLFPGGMATRHLASSVPARPAHLGRAEVDSGDLAVMLAHQPMADGDVATPEHAVRNLIADLEANETARIGTSSDGSSSVTPPSRFPRRT